MASKNNNYFLLIKEQAYFCLEAAKALHASFVDFSPEKLDKDKEDLHKIEHDADNKKHDIVGKLAKEFITPIEREDIMQLTEQIDNLTDTIEDVVIKTYMYNIRELRPEAVEFSELIVTCCEKLQIVCTEFATFRKSSTIKPALIEVNRLEEEGDRIFDKAVSRLFREENSAATLIAWKDIFHCLEECCDACEHVCDVIEEVILKNT